MLEVENDVLKVSPKKHHGAYGNTKGKSANALYASYKTYVVNNGGKPIPFKEWVQWAIKKGILSENFGANANPLVEDKTAEIKVLEKDIEKNNSRIVSVIFVAVAVIVLWGAFKQDGNK